MKIESQLLMVNKKLKDFINKNYNEFSNLDGNETYGLELNDPNLDIDMINYLKTKYRFDYKGICVYYNEDEDQVWVENMEA